MRIITGATGTAHVTSNDDGEFNLGLWGDGLVVLPNGNKLAATITDNNTITIADGDLIFQGRHALINPGSTESVTIATGTVDMNRKDLIVARYKLNTSTGVESLTLEVLEGTETSGSAADPTYTTGTIRTGSTTAEVPLYRVNISGITITSIDKLFTPVKAMSENFGTELVGTLTAGQTEITFTNSEIKTDGTFDFYTSIFGVNPKAVTVTNGSLTITFGAQAEDVDVKVVIR